ncbi:transcriptional regulator, LysR family protein [Oceanicola granulosus HTCC2516]|uniref:Transcriptional regulator, LysR family protein n=1 Tax=Oceanicola granulosus (strain ATCC BAA-861 / DSM 15982 / KCTC 12143 / HTCC2516) TaxID=314256 RepID=Q2CEI4_OCEGH|nr:LysR family transcriptional regulator [Oceanicola granulosus]EAR51013.1 transcriptional regulator, LysR family protein [Oceanicola granulosus HTCC2516]
MQRHSWDDLRFVLAVAETGSVAAAARELAVNHATVLRRIAAFERRVGQAVFERTPHGYRLPPERFGLIEAARGVAAAVEGVERLANGVSGPGQPVRITSTDSLCVAVLPPICAALAAAGVPVELRSSNRHLDLGRLHADIAVRPAERLPAELAGVEAGALGFALYAAGPEVEGWLGAQGALARSRAAAWLADNGAESDLRGGADSFLALRELAALGLGRTLLPCCLGAPDPRLVRVGTGGDAFAVPLWVATHPDLGDAARIRTARDRLADALRDAAGILRDGA